MIASVNDPDIKAEVRSAFEGYNVALAAGDVEKLNEFFWNSASTVRFGPTENLFGFAEISSFRSSRWKLTGGNRAIQKVEIATFGPDAATTSALIRDNDGNVSRQSQTWVRFSEGWRIVAAHVSRSPV